MIPTSLSSSQCPHRGYKVLPALSCAPLPAHSACPASMASLLFRCLRPHPTSGPLCVVLALLVSAQFTACGFSSWHLLCVSSLTFLLKAAAACTWHFLSPHRFIFPSRFPLSDIARVTLPWFLSVFSPERKPSRVRIFVCVQY